MAEPEPTSAALNLKASGVSGSSNTTYRISRTIHLDNISSKFSNRVTIFSDEFFSQHDPHPIIFRFLITFGGETAGAYLGAYVDAVSQDAIITFIKISTYNSLSSLISTKRHGNENIVPKGMQIGFQKLLKCEAAAASASLRMVFEFEYEAVSTDIAKLKPLSSDCKTRFHNEFRRLLESGKNSDVVFLVDGEKIKAHKIILTTRCEYFESMFDSGMAESTSKEIVVTDVEPAVFERLLRFIYADEKPQPDSRTDIMMGLLIAADKYGVDDLKAYCETTLCSRLNTKNVIEALLLAETHNCSVLMATAMSVFASFVHVLRKQDKWNELKKSPSLLLKLLEHSHK